MPRKLLLADDSITIQKVVAIALAAEDFAITCVDNGEEAIAKAREIRPDVVLADAVMPGRTGYEVCQEIKGDPALASTPVIILAGTFEAFDEGRANAASADGWVQKPFESQALIDKINAAIARGGARASVPAAVAPSAPVPAVARAVPAAPVAPAIAPAVAAAAPVRPSVVPAVPAARPVVPAAPVPPAPGAARPPVVARPPGPVPPAAVRPPVPGVPAGARPAVPSPGVPRPPGPAVPGVRPPVPGVPGMAGAPRGPVPGAGMPRPAGPVPPMGRPPVPGAPGVARPPTPGIPVAARPAVMPAAPRPIASEGMGEEVSLGDLGEAAPSAMPAVGSAAHEALLREALSKASKELIERIVWEVVPQLAETIIREELERLIKDREAKP